MRFARQSNLQGVGRIGAFRANQGRALVSRVIAASALLAAASLAFQLWPASAATVDLHAATVIVTGRSNLAERTRGIREALPLVITRLSADSAVGQRAIEQGLQDQAETLVRDLEYRDRKEGIQISDEQGTRDRSFELTVHFDPAAIDAMVAQLGGTVWSGERPEVAVALIIDDSVSRFLLTEGSDRGYGQRLALNDVSEALALPVVLPKASGDPVDAQAAQEAALSEFPVKLAGEMTVTSAGYWNTDWRLEAPDGVAERFATSETTFDVAIEEALRRSAKLLANR
ncbi:DUF2066 domain-containing protein [Tianweitania sediminis]|uniref:DUF2066 domain-containing protein n=1 Tax=Tianweitania sediminis TaxID=1502156 RepID=A0A8J7R1Z0_9HYPH|nr:DUF2066 domain-containing protein [Tianweitania sediminis]MBP0439303.1 DUF2066 domain-containing protein [Tianweitania sediminis]